MATSREQLRVLAAGEELYNSEPALDAPGEVWFWASGYSLRIHSEGRLYKGAAPHLPGKVTARHTLYRVADHLVVDIEERGARARVRRGVLNGRLVHSNHATSEVPALLAKFRKLRFRDGSPWNASKKKVLQREFAKKLHPWMIAVDGSVLDIAERIGEDWISKDERLPSREAAIARAEVLIAKREAVGFRTRLIELRDAQEKNPEPVPPKGVAKKPKAPRGPKFDKPTNAFEAVDLAVTMLREAHTRLPKHHFVTECLQLPKDKQRIDEVNGDVKFFTSLHKQRIGRWLKAKPGKPKKTDSSWTYFVRTYGSLTWILDSHASEELRCFYCGNMSGGGWSPLEVSENQYDMDDLIEATGDESLEALEVFHGGWHDGCAFAFDSRHSDDGGELAIVPFDETDPKLPKKSKVVPFRNWLHQRVVSQLRIVEKNIAELA